MEGMRMELRRESDKRQRGFSPARERGFSPARERGFSPARERGFSPARERGFSPARERGFSMVELMVAMVVTLVVSGAIFGLLTVGGNAFRKEPEVADRQQNIRIAMDAIARDVENAGSGMPLVSQVFTHTDTPLAPANPTGFGPPYLNGQGPVGVMGNPGQALRGAPPTGTFADGSDNSDVLEVLIAEAACPSFHACAPPAAPLTFNGTATVMGTRETIPANGCMLSPAAVGTQGLVLLTDSRLFTIQPATLGAAGTLCGAAAATNGTVALAAALPEWPTTAGQTITSAQVLVYSARVVRYMIAPGIDPLETAPALWRSDTGRYTAAGAASLVPAAGATNWQMIARGIEDLQVEYLNGGNLWSNNPGVVAVCAAAGCTVGDYNNVVRRVRITLSARALAPRLQGESAPLGGTAPNAVRGQLVTVATPRAAVLGLQTLSGVTGWQ